MTDTALKPIDTTPLAFLADIVGPVYSFKDRRVRFGLRSIQEVTNDEYLRLCELVREGYECWSVLVPDAKSAEDVTIPPKPEIKQTQGTKKLTAAQRQRLKLEELARERGAVTPKLVEEFYQERMAMNLKKLQLELEELRKEKANNRAVGT